MGAKRCSCGAAALELILAAAPSSPRRWDAAGTVVFSSDKAAEACLVGTSCTAIHESLLALTGWSCCNHDTAQRTHSGGSNHQSLVNRGLATTVIADDPVSPLRIVEGAKPTFVHLAGDADANGRGVRQSLRDNFSVCAGKRGSGPSFIRAARRHFKDGSVGLNDRSESERDASRLPTIHVSDLAQAHGIPECPDAPASTENGSILFQPLSKLVTQHRMAHAPSPRGTISHRDCLWDLRRRTKVLRSNAKRSSPCLLIQGYAATLVRCLGNLLHILKEKPLR
jgi:hypothetical protein